MTMLLKFEDKKLAPNAGLCPLAGGKSVFVARSLLSAWIYEMPDYDDMSICANAGIQALTKYQSGETVSVYPNPANDVLSVQFELGADATLTIFDVLGRKVLVQALSLTDGYIEIPVSHLENGIYYIVVMRENMPVVFSALLQINR